MKLSIKWFAISAMIMGTLPFMILFTWCAINGFGAEVVRLFESVHPSGGFSILENIDKSFIGRLPGVIINTLYIAIDCFIAGLAFSALYNFLVTKFEK